MTERISHLTHRIRAVVAAALALTIASVGLIATQAAHATGETHTTVLTETQINRATGDPNNPFEFLMADDGVQAPVASFTVPVEIPADATEFALTGQNWTRVDGTPSGFMVQYNQGGILPVQEAPNSTSNPGFDNSRGRAWALQDAGPGGNIELTLPVPTAENSSLDADLQPGQEFTVMVLGGSITNQGEGDWVRNPQVTIRIGEPEADQPDLNHEVPDWPHLRVSPSSDPSAVAYISEQVSSSGGSTIRVQGNNWVNERTDTGSTIALKLNGDLNDSGTGFTQYTRSGADIIEHPSATGDDTIWVLIAPENPDNHPHIYPIADDGSFDIEFAVPEGLRPGQHLSILFQSGRFAVETVNRSVTSSPITVDGVPWVDPRGHREEIICTTDLAQPTVELVTTRTELGGEIIVRGEGWCHPEEGHGASSIAFKIDEGDISHLDTSLHPNQTIWHIVDADSDDMDQTTGTWQTTIPMPDGTTATSNPALQECRHSFRLLTGSLKPGDMIRTMRTDDFIVGSDQPCGTVADPVAFERLTPENRGPVTFNQRADYFTVTVRGASQGDYIYLTDYFEDGSPNYSWADTWFRLDDQLTARVPLDRIELGEGETRVAVQAGSTGEVGEFIGWGSLYRGSAAKPLETDPAQGQQQPPQIIKETVEKIVEVEVPVSQLVQPAPGQSMVPPPAPLPGPIQQTLTGPGQVPGQSAAPAPEVPALAPMPTDAPPLLSRKDLTDDNAGDIYATLDSDGLLVLNLPVDTSAWVHVTLFPDEKPLGWIAQDLNGDIRLDVSTVPDGEYYFALQGTDGELIGWVQLLLGDDDGAAAEEPDTVEAAPPIPVTNDPDVTDAEPASSVLSTADWTLMALGLGVLAGVAAGLLASRAGGRTTTAGATA